ncbi:Maf family protein [Burkholderiaceae bacterium DAT-1]|nr:Maf family protein [Burkholderiaceae bacterium DAT-1]
MSTASRPLIHLASASPRRRELLTQAGIPFELIRSEVDETPLANEAAKAYVERLARDKAHAGWQKAVSEGNTPRWLLSADTTVALGDVILGKPESTEEAVAMLTRLSGSHHEVFTGIAVASPDGVRSAVVRSEVRFRELTEAVIRAYVSTGEPMDKAGSYGLQGQGGVLVSGIVGSPSNIVGLPIAETVDLLIEAGYPYWGVIYLMAEGPTS